MQSMRRRRRYARKMRPQPLACCSPLLIGTINWYYIDIQYIYNISETATAIVNNENLFNHKPCTELFGNNQIMVIGFGFDLRALRPLLKKKKIYALCGFSIVVAAKLHTQKVRERESETQFEHEFPARLSTKCGIHNNTCMCIPFMNT